MTISVPWLVFQIKNKIPLSEANEKEFEESDNRPQILASALNKINPLPLTEDQFAVVQPLLEYCKAVKLQTTDKELESAISKGSKLSRSEFIKFYLTPQNGELLANVLKGLTPPLSEEAQNVVETLFTYCNPKPEDVIASFGEEKVTLKELFELKKVQPYPEEVREDSKKYGYKTANLMHLERLIRKLVKNGTLKNVKVPSVHPVDHHDVSAFFENKKVLHSINKLWEEACDLIEKNSASGITPEVEKKLEEIQSIIKKCFSKNLFSTDKISSEGHLIARSSGKNEDKEGMPNPGGNESVNCQTNAKALSEAIGRVIASYFSKKSLSQRIASGTSAMDVFKKDDPPQPSCVWQPFVGESTPLTNDDIEKGNEPPVAGVVYTDGNGNSHMQVTFGANTLVVDGESSHFDIIDVINSEVYMAVRNKKERDVPIMKDGKIVTEQRKNTRSLARKHCITEEQAAQLAIVCQEIEKEYKMAMDIEFVIDEKGVINIVQARAVQNSELKGAALDPEYIANNHPERAQGTTVTANLLRAKEIANADDLLICEDIEMALKMYLDLSPEKKLQLKGFVVKNPSPSGSHPSGQFLKDKKPVIQLAPVEYQQVVGWHKTLESDSKKLVIDPQYSSIFRLDPSGLEDGKAPIKEGLFRSPLSPHISPIHLDKFEGKEQAQAKISTTMQEWLRENVGLELLQRGPITSKLLRESVDVLSRPPENAMKNGDIIDALRICLSFALSVYQNKQGNKKNIISDALAQKFLYTSSHLIDKLNEYSGEPDPNKKQVLWKEYLDIHKKFEGLLVGQPERGVFAQSIIAEATRVVRQRKVEANQDSLYHIPEKVTGGARDCMRYLLGYVGHIPKENNQQLWRNFCLKLLDADMEASENNMQHMINMASMLEYLKEVGERPVEVEEQEEEKQTRLDVLWLNLNVIPKLKKVADSDREISQENSLKQESNLILNFDNEQNKEERQRIISALRVVEKMESPKVVANFAQPENFDISFERLQKQILGIKKLILDAPKNKRVDALNEMLKNQLLFRMVQAVDQSMKKLQTIASSQGDTTKQVHRYQNITFQFLQVLNYISKDVYASKNNTIVKHYFEQNFKAYKAKLAKLKDSSSANQFDISRGFNAKAALIDQKKTEFERGIKNVRTVADMHSAIHQSCLNTLSAELDKAYPEAKLAMLLPKDMYDIIYGEEGITKKLKNGDESEYRVASVDVNTPFVTVGFEASLREHSTHIDLIYNYETNRLTIKQTFSGFGTDGEETRWLEIMGMTSYLISNEFKDEDVSIQKCHAGRSSGEIEIDMPFNQAKKVLKHLKMAAYYSGEYIYGFNIDPHEINKTCKLETEQAFNVRLSTLINSKDFKNLTTTSNVNIEDIKQETFQVIDECRELDSETKEQMKKSPTVLALIHLKLLEPAVFSDITPDQIKKMDESPRLTVFFDWFINEKEFSPANKDHISWLCRADEKLIDVLAFERVRRGCFLPAKTSNRFLDLKTALGMAPIKLNLLTSDGAIECYLGQEGIFPTYKDLIEYNEDFIRLLTSADARKCYQENIQNKKFPSFRDMVEIINSPNANSNKPYSLLSNLAVKTYSQLEGPSFSDLKELDTQSIKLLVSTNAIFLYRMRKDNPHCPTYEQLLTLGQKTKGNQEWEILTDYHGTNYYDEINKDPSGCPSFEQLSQLDHINIRNLISSGAVECFRQNANGHSAYPSFEELKQVFNQKFKGITDSSQKQVLLTNANAIECYNEHSCNENTSFPSFAQLNKLPLDVIRACLTKQALTCYEESNISEQSYPSFSTLSKMDSEKIECLTSNELLGFYENEGAFQKLSQYYDKLKGNPRSKKEVSTVKLKDFAEIVLKLESHRVEGTNSYSKEHRNNSIGSWV